VQLKVNGHRYDVHGQVGTTLAEALREELSLTGTKIACGEGHCGACTVLVDGEPVLSCITLVHAVEGARVTTIEGLRDHPMIDAFVRRAVHPLVGHFPDPLPQLPIEVDQAARFAALKSTQEVPAYILHAGFNLAFRLSAIGSAKPRPKTPVPGEIQKHRMPDDLATFVGSQPYRFHAVIQNLGRHAA